MQLTCVQLVYIIDMCNIHFIAAAEVLLFAKTESHSAFILLGCHHVEKSIDFTYTNRARGIKWFPCSALP